MFKFSIESMQEGNKARMSIKGDCIEIALYLEYVLTKLALENKKSKAIVTTLCENVIKNISKEDN